MKEVKEMVYSRALKGVIAGIALIVRCDHWICRFGNLRYRHHNIRDRAGGLLQEGALMFTCVQDEGNVLGVNF